MGMGRKQAKLDAACSLLKSRGVKHGFNVQGDVRQEQSGQEVVRQVVAHYGKLDILVNNAAGNFLCLLEDLSFNAWKTVIDIDLNGTFNMSKCAFESLKNGGSIINISATLHYGASTYLTHASAAKAGIDALTRGLATEWRHHGIRVNAIAPGPISDTEGMDRLAPKAAPKSYEVPYGEKDDIAFAAVYLSSTAGKDINGELFVVDGGTWMSKPDTVDRNFYNKHIRRSKL